MMYYEKLFLVATLCAANASAFVAKPPTSSAATKASTTSPSALDSTVIDRMSDRRLDYGTRSRGYGSGYSSRGYDSDGYGSYGSSRSRNSRGGRYGNYPSQTWGGSREGGRIYGGRRQTRQLRYEDTHAQVSLSSERSAPIYADLEVWSGPGYSPQSVKVYSEDGYRYPFHAIMETNQYTSGGGEQALSILNSGTMEFPIDARVEGTRGARRSNAPMKDLYGGSLKTFQFDASVRSIQVDLESDGLPIMASIELWEGPGECKVLAEIDSDDGISKPFTAILETTGYDGCTIAIRNTGPMAYPLRASADPIEGGRGRSGRDYGRGGSGSNLWSGDRYGNYERSYGSRNGGGYGGSYDRDYDRRGGSSNVFDRMRYGRGGSSDYNYMVDSSYYSDGWNNRYSPNFYSDSYTRMGDSYGGRGYNRSW